MRTLILSKETVRKLDDDTLEKIAGGGPLAHLTNNCDTTTNGACRIITNCLALCQ